ncbi:MAG: type II toxin-antitoxin system VapC family toxin [Acidimicrobiales bacterium]
MVSSPAPVSGTFYLDSSVGLRIILGQSPSSAAWFDRATGDDTSMVVSSRLLRTEITRVLRREGLPVGRRDTLLSYIGTIPLDHAVLNEAEAIVPHVRSLDAIHLASAVRSGLEDLIIVTHDQAMREVAEQIGFATHDPVADL